MYCKFWLAASTLRSKCHHLSIEFEPRRNTYTKHGTAYQFIPYLCVQEWLLQGLAHPLSWSFIQKHAFELGLSAMSLSGILQKASLASCCFFSFINDMPQIWVTQYHISFSILVMQNFLYTLTWFDGAAFKSMRLIFIAWWKPDKLGAYITGAVQHVQCSCAVLITTYASYSCLVIEKKQWRGTWTLCLNEFINI